MKTIEINSGDEVYAVKVDDGDFDLLSRHKWYIMFVGSKKRPYAFTRFYTGHDKKNGKTLLMHHMIMGTSGAVDHIDGDSLNNSKENLRVATYQENGWNKGKAKAGPHGEFSSKYKGVSKYTKTDGTACWRVIIKLTKKGEKPAKFVRLGPFANEIDAAKAYNKEIVKHRPGFAWVNPLHEVG